MKLYFQISVILFAFVLNVQAAEIPELNWVEKSDWINVKTDSRIKAKGDGRTDDTRALQNAIDQLDISNPDIRKRKSTVYLPEGIYMISSTLEMKLKRGVAIIGSGKGTIIVWGGAKDGTMFQSNGNNRSRFIGINWDGRSKAKYGVLHSNKDISAFETRIRHEYETFANLEYGIAGMLPEKSSAGKGLATAETIIQNCHFKNVNYAITLADFNYYNWVIDNCTFEKSKVAIYTPYGTCFVRNSRFEESSDADFVLGAYPNGYTIRRVVSINSNRFIRHRAAFYLPCPLVIENCIIKDWKAVDAIHLLTRGPSMIVDCSFIKDGAKQPIQILADRRAGFKTSTPDGKIHRILLSGNRLNGRDQNILNVFGRNNDVDILNIPKASNLPNMLTLESKFGSEVVGKFSSNPSSKSINILNELPANINPERQDISNYLQSLIDKYSKSREEIVIYFPIGKYIIQNTIKVNSDNLVLQGSGFESSLDWNGSPEDPMIEVNNSTKLFFEQLKFTNKEIPQEYLVKVKNTSGKKSFIAFDGVYHNHNSAKKNLQLQDILFDGLNNSTFVYMNHAEFSFHSKNSSNTTFLIDKFFNYYQTAIRISGNGNNSFNNMNFLSSVVVAGSSNADFIIEDNNSMVMTDLYHESGKSHLFISGRGKGSGRISIQGVKHDFLQNGKSDTLLYSNNYSGSLFYGPQNFFNNVKQQNIIVSGNKLKVYFVGVNINDTLPNIKGKVNFLMSIKNNRKSQGDQIFANSNVSKTSLNDIAMSLNDIKYAGLIDSWIKGGDNDKFPSKIKSLSSIVFQ